MLPGVVRHTFIIFGLFTTPNLCPPLTQNPGDATEYVDCFGLPDMVSVVKRKKKFLMKYVNSANRLCQLFSVDALSECNSYV